jgi:hypothetical protein
MKTALVITAALLAGSVQAQPVWRCNEGGRVVYQGEPCRGGRAVEAPLPRSAADEAEARRVATREQALAQKLAAERRQREHEPVALAAGIPDTPTRLSPSKKPRLTTKHQLELDAGARTWRAGLPSSRQKPD